MVTTPENTQRSDQPDRRPTCVEGTELATSARKTPFQPMLDRPTRTKQGQSNGPVGRSAMPTSPTAATTDVSSSPVQRLPRNQRSEITAQPRRPTVPPTIITANDTPAIASP